MLPNTHLSLLIPNLESFSKPHFQNLQILSTYSLGISRNEDYEGEASEEIEDNQNNRVFEATNSSQFKCIRWIYSYFITRIKFPISLSLFINSHPDPQRYQEECSEQRTRDHEAEIIDVSELIKDLEDQEVEI